MNLSRKWLSEFVSVEADDKEFAESMTLSGSKVELTHDLGAEIQNVVVGKVLSMEHHPDSDHMWVCKIDVGREEPVQIVHAQVHPAWGQEDRKGQAAGRGVQRHAVRPE